jgi:hypothetical protein
MFGLGDGTLSLAALADPTAELAMNLFFWDNPSSSNKEGIKGLNIYTLADGSTQVASSAVPIPPAFFLMGSGLLGMIGLRRRMA